MKGYLLLLALLPVALAVVGVDVSSPTNTFSCLKKDGYDFAIVRGYQSNGELDPNAHQTIANAKAAGVPYVDVYLFPCVPCGNPAGQADALWNHLKGQFGTVWLDIETLSWSSSQASNQVFITTLANTLTNAGAHVGIYTNYYNWESIVGLGWTGMSRYPLWYAHYDNNPSFSDFKPFGGWSKPAMKQYNTGTACGSGVDFNYYP